jgi:polyhydroxybutyrate depolymerase
MPDRDMQDGTRVRRELYAQCMEASEVVLFTVQGGGHTLPGGRQYLPERLIGITSRDIDGSQIIWDFFKKQSGR